MRIWAVALVLALGLGSACGGKSSSHALSKPRPTTTRSATRRPAFVRVPANALVMLRRFSPKSLMWQTIFIRPDGSGVLTTLIGEISGAPQRPFHLSATQTAELRRLLRAGRSARPQPSAARDYVYTLHIAGQPSVGFKGGMPKPLAALVDFLGGLMVRYCC